jgi:hypothetical protein
MQKTEADYVYIQEYLNKKYKYLKTEHKLLKLRLEK